MIQLQAFVIALYPFCFIEMDGYHVLADRWACPLKQDAVAYLGQVLKEAGIGRLSREKGVWSPTSPCPPSRSSCSSRFNVWLISTATR